MVSVHLDIALKVIVRIFIYLIFYSIICIFFMGFFPVNAGMVGLFSMKKRSLNTNVEHSVLSFVFCFLVKPQKIN